MKFVSRILNLIFKHKSSNIKNEIGAQAENFVADFLKSIGYKIIEVNYRTKVGEIDIIAIDQNYIVFVEVKYRKDATNFGGAKAAVTWQKQKKIIKTAKIFLAKKFKNKSDMPNSRFDVVTIDGILSLENLKHYKKAFATK